MIKIPSSQVDSFPPDPVIEAYKEGVDRALIRKNLQRSVEERIAHLQALVTHAEQSERARRGRSS
jgi:hypothetical protein